MKHVFLSCHPAVTFLYMMAAILCAMLTLHPGWVLISFITGSCYAIFLGGLKRWLLGLRLLAVLFFVVAIGNPLFNHRGATPLFLLWGAPVTLESVFYGLCMGGMLVSVFVWFQCYQVLMTNDRFLFLFGRIAPASALVLSMILKFIPVTARKYHSIQNARTGLGSGQVGGRRERIRASVRTTGILMSWSMETAIDTADSMKARGYGATRRSHFSRYVLTPRDLFSLCYIGGLFLGNLTLILLVANRFRFFPFLTGDREHLFFFGIYGLMLLYPLLLEGKERLRWAGR
jgi:energy-coupling factor transport system permease protein